ncbi:MAG TPA: hypothetical protein VGG32_05240 [Thermoplasmata archaeon]
MPESEPPSPIPWEAVVSVREDAALERELTARLEREGGPRSVGVTDLINLRRAFYRTVAPAVPIPAARQVRLDQGRALHRTLGARLAREGTLEARVRRDGLVGRIDILADLPIEVKTATSLVEPSELPAHRPDHIEQLGMYCALVDRPTGRLLTLVASPVGVSEVQAVDLSFRSTPRILYEMRRRADLLRTAWAEARVDPLPRCPWYGRGCEFEEASVCACTGEEEPVLHPIPEEVETISPRYDVRERVRSALSEPVPFEETVPVGRFRELLYPRRAYFDRTAPATPSAPAPPREVSPSSAPAPDLYARLSGALESGPAGEVARLPARSAEPEEEVVGFRGRPLLMRTSRAWARYREDELVTRAPQYALELGLRCATTGTDSGVVVVGFERAEVDRDGIQVLEVRFGSLTPFSRLYRERSRGLSIALRDRAPGNLPSCPDWMTLDCPYRSECGCGGPDARVTR